MKLLASLLGCAVADYACCPYDEFGVVNQDCPLTEKTPWAMKDNNANTDPMGVEHHVCKAWEANVGAAIEGNEDLDNWGGCGFQRHFPWAIADANILNNVDANSIINFPHCQLGMFDCSGGTSKATNSYKTLQVAGTNFNLEKTATKGGPFTTATNDIFGEVRLGAICKLFVPVQEHNIDSVSIAGVHVNGRYTTTVGTSSVQTASVFAANICGVVDCASGNKKAKGTAYCFSVVNVGEFMENNMPNSQFNVMNGNVAGSDTGGGDPLTLPGLDGLDFPKNFGDSIEPTGDGTNTIVEAGASFDVVVHFKSKYCMRHWSLVDMQVDPDFNSGGTVDYPLAAHKHSDVVDKRITGVGICGCCSSDGSTRHDEATVLASTLAADGCAKCLAASGCEDFDNYNVPTTMKWPNIGAWAAFYSFVSCADNTMMIYNQWTGIDGTSGALQGVTSKDRDVVHSMFYNDVRHDWSNAHHGTGKLHVRGNFRQVGDKVTYCGPGKIPDSDTKRCTWNWNFELGTDAETWFTRTSPINVNVWQSGAAVKRPEDAKSLAGGALTGILESPVFTISIKQHTTGVDNTAIAALTANELTMDANKYFTKAAGTHSATAGYLFDVTMNCLQSSADGTGSKITATYDAAALGDNDTNGIVRDKFPDCYMGDEIHFSVEFPSGPTANNYQRVNAWYSSVVAKSNFA